VLHVQHVLYVLLHSLLFLGFCHACSKHSKANSECQIDAKPYTVSFGYANGSQNTADQAAGVLQDSKHAYPTSLSLLARMPTPGTRAWQLDLR
jgi:hypothetical protein